jgi:hypothetical protein
MAIKHPFAQATEVSAATLGWDAVACCRESKAQQSHAQNVAITSEHVVQVGGILHEKRFHLINKQNF